MDNLEKRIAYLEKWQLEKSNTWLMGDSFIRRCISIFFHYMIAGIVVWTLVYVGVFMLGFIAAALGI